MHITQKVYYINYINIGVVICIINSDVNSTNNIKNNCE